MRGHSAAVCSKLLKDWIFGRSISRSETGRRQAERKFGARSALGSDKAEIDRAMQLNAKCQEVKHDDRIDTASV